MIIPNSTQVHSSSLLIPFDGIQEEDVYKIYHDGGHFVGTKFYRKLKEISREKKEKTDLDKSFDNFYTLGLKSGFKLKKYDSSFKDYIIDGLKSNLFYNIDLEDYVNKGLKRKQHNLYLRKKRLRRKAYLNKWNYWVTFTYDDKKLNAESFRKKLRKCLCNLKTRKNWRYMGVFEHSPEENRVHFHAVMYIPDGQMPGIIEEKKSFSTKTQRMEIRNENSFFARRFGVNDFTEITENTLKHGNMLEYMLKYMEKQGEKIVYSRGIAQEICKVVSTTDVITQFTDYVEKYVFLDDVVSWEKDIMQYKPRQISFLNFNYSTT